MFDIREELKKLPASPGVYIMHDRHDEIIYVGKAVNLHNRVRSYFRKIVGRGPQIDRMVSQIDRFEYIVTDSELEALVLENNLIKSLSPRYNHQLQETIMLPGITDDYKIGYKSPHKPYQNTSVILNLNPRFPTSIRPYHTPSHPQTTL